ncbi:MAG: hypothetical protein IT280_13440, partial [Ignavibacteria bacterium]|nr:hypothetical protein [Ignavibacteria bacterium]
MKYLKFSLIIFFFVFSSSNLFSQIDPHHNRLTIRNDRVFLLNDAPFFPIGVCFELGETEYHNEFYKNYPWSPNKWGFNFINLFSQNAWLFNCGNSKNVISGDTSTSSQYRDILEKYWGNINWHDNYDRINNYLDNDVYLLGDCLAFTSNDATHWEWNGVSGTCGDSITVDPPFNQTVRNQHIWRIDSLARENDSKLFGFYSMDDANFFQAQGPEDPMYYYNNFRDNKIEDLDSSYNYARFLYNKSIVMMSIVPFFFPKAFDPTNWTDVEKTRDAWVEDAVNFSQGANVLFSPAYMSMENSNDWAGIYENGYPKWYPKHIKETLFDRVLAGANENKAVMGGIIFDVYQSNPDPSDSLMDRKVKWDTYVGLQKGATGLIYFGWHVKSAYTNIWNAIKKQVDTLANVLNLDENVFVKGNSGAVGHNLTSSLINGDASYAVYKVNNWDEYYLLVTNNPTGAIDDPEADNTVSIQTDVNLCLYDVTEIFSNNTITPSGLHQFNYQFPWFGTALFHIKLKNPVPDNCPDERPDKNTNSEIPIKFYISQNYPNPFNPITEITFGLPTDEFVTIEIFNSIGQKISILMNEV